jgi:cytochrome c-type biogenesis protein CcmE
MLPGKFAGTPQGAAMTRKWRRALTIAAGTGALAIAAQLMLKGLRDNVVFFHTPNEALARHLPAGTRLRLGGLVANGSVHRSPDGTVSFLITDNAASIPVVYSGILPDLFREGQGVVAEGRLDAAGRFQADTVLAKHDETYMPPEVARALKEKGVWKSGGVPPGSARSGGL